MSRSILDFVDSGSKFRSKMISFILLWLKFLKHVNTNVKSHAQSVSTIILSPLQSSNSILVPRVSQVLLLLRKETAQITSIKTFLPHPISTNGKDQIVTQNWNCNYLLAGYIGYDDNTKTIFVNFEILKIKHKFLHETVLLWDK